MNHPKSTSPRLQALIDSVVPGLPVADIGTDHAIVPAHLVHVDRVPHAIGVDLRPGPLAAARRNLGHCERVELRQGNGLEPVRPGEVGTIVIAGMGGALIQSIVDAAPQTVGSVRRLVLAPNTQWTKTREWIAAHRWPLVGEKMVLDQGKFYLVLIVEPTSGPPRQWSARDLEFGPHLRRQRPDVFIAYLRHRVDQTRRLLTRLTREQVDPSRAEALRQDLTRLCDELGGAAPDLR